MVLSTPSSQTSGLGREKRLAKSNLHIVPHREELAVRREGLSPASSVHPTQLKAQEAGRPTAQRERVELVIHGRDGKIRDSESYGHDPNPPKDWP